MSAIPDLDHKFLRNRAGVLEIEQLGSKHAWSNLLMFAILSQH